MFSRKTLGPEGLARLTNFSAREVNGLWCDIAEDVLLSWNVGRGRRCKVTPKDVLFMVVVVLKVGGTWDALAAMFKMKGPTFEKMIMKFMVILEPIVYELCVAKPASELTMKKQHLSGQSFRNFPEAYYATDLKSQQCNRPSGNMHEGQVYRARHQFWEMCNFVNFLLDRARHRLKRIEALHTDTARSAMMSKALEPAWPLRHGTKEKLNAQFTS
ncbi:TPA: hypothetical protein N0F65_003799 [Lagenidium giganteum]|uniref:Transposase n=1 Tax=Lagenidium giganteum TaxID=4803 RepID=A0AAV2YZF6_9STRA|nr:TPA: hypothetical protein N0F65_003799 [Lagenidium giganteum]